MIVTSLPRSGSTKYCMDLSYPNSDLTYIDEVFELAMTTQHKVLIHRIKDIKPQLKTAEYISKLDFDTCVINNHEINWFTLENTDVFLSRQNAQDTVWSYVAYMYKYHSTIHNLENNMIDSLLPFFLHLFKLRMHLFYEYIVVKNKTVVFPNLEFTDQLTYREKYSKWSGLVTKMGDNLILPNGVIFK
jgi:hypothetical protein